MEIKIDLDYVEGLKNEIVFYEKKVKELEYKLSSLDESKLKSEAESLSKNLLGAYLDLVFKKLGFDHNIGDLNPFKENMSHWLGKSWWLRDEEVKIELGATITSEWRRAFLTLGINPNKSGILKEEDYNFTHKD